MTVIGPGLRAELGQPLLGLGPQSGVAAGGGEPSIRFDGPGAVSAQAVRFTQPKQRRGVVGCALGQLPNRTTARRRSAALRATSA